MKYLPLVFNVSQYFLKINFICGTLFLIIIYIYLIIFLKNNPHKKNEDNQKYVKIKYAFKHMLLKIVLNLAPKKRKPMFLNMFFYFSLLKMTERP